MDLDGMEALSEARPFIGQPGIQGLSPRPGGTSRAEVLSEGTRRLGKTPRRVTDGRAAMGEGFAYVGGLRRGS